GERHLYAVTDGWAIVRSPTVGIRTTRGRVAADERYRVDGEGAAGPHMTYLGAHTTRVRNADQRFRLVVPEAAEMTATPAAALDTLEHASGRLGFGERDESVFVVVAPTSVEWAATGLQRGDADLWIRDVQPVDTPTNAWIHEYVHTRQEHEPTRETRWTVEAMAEYYAALLPYEAGRISFQQFRRKLTRGRSDTYEDVVLAAPSTWEANDGDYVTGALVWGALDRRLNADATSMDAVAASFGTGELDHEQFLGAVETAGGRPSAARWSAPSSTRTPSRGPTGPSTSPTRGSSPARRSRSPSSSGTTAPSPATTRCRSGSTGRRSASDAAASSRVSGRRYRSRGRSRPRASSTSGPGPQPQRPSSSSRPSRR
ncbi:hypothetical protein BRD11_04040, partial [Halobacteriales archaeon SW_12_69_24]